MDPVFQTTYPTTIPLPTGSFTVYYPDYHVSVIGCTEQYQICKDAHYCTPPGGQEALPNEIENLNLNLVQYVTAQRFIYMIGWANTYSSVNGIGPEALRLWNEVYNFISPPVPANQWELEVEGWFQTTLAKWQTFMVEYAFSTTTQLGPSGHIGFPVTNATLDPIWHGQCRSQRISNLGGYQNVSAIGFAMIWAVGGFIVVLSWCLKWTVSSLSNKMGRNDHPGARARRIAWNIDGKLQQQRIALHTAGYTALKGGESDVPYLEAEAELPLPFVEVEEGDDSLYQRLPLSDEPHRRDTTNEINIEMAHIDRRDTHQPSEAHSGASEHSQSTTSPLRTPGAFPESSNPLLQNFHAHSETESGLRTNEQQRDSDDAKPGQPSTPQPHEAPDSSSSNS